jgi:hypothetical protein
MALRAAATARRKSCMEATKVMKQIFLMAAGLAGLALVVSLTVHDGRAQGQGGLPGTQQPPARPAQLPWLESKSNPTASDPFFPAPTAKPTAPVWNLPQEGPDPNQEFFVTPAQGPWMIFMTSYTTDRMTPDVKAKQLANQMVRELRANYQLPAYVFNYGEAERRKEFERAHKAIEHKKEEMRKNGLSTDTPIRVPFTRIDIQCAVLVGGFKDAAAARREMERLRKIQVNEKQLARLPSQYELFLIDPRVGKGENAKVNPFLKSHVVPNPTVRQERSAEPEKLDISVLKRLNAEETYSLLKCPKAWTLAVKQYQLPADIQPKDAPKGSLLQKLGWTSKSSERGDAAASHAQQLAQFLRKGKWESYVLHTKHASIVTVGSYDSPDDPRLARDRQALADINTRLPQEVRLFPNAMPMPVPR